MTELTHQQAAILAFEKVRWRYPGAKDAEVLRRFGMSGVRYAQVVNALIDLPAAEVVEPGLVRRLRRLRDVRRRERSGRRSASC
jgi:hypothetical protein